ncbi:MAG TPA: nicotinate-nucleotide adenylyltransferase [Acidimicrobiales bacterium]|nr:nicotinate-nucleotide adenylyltransferase [Acidimicrobiales bacterium]
MSAGPAAPGATGPRRIGVFGGTFDPVHVGHLVAAVNARHSLGLERVLLVVSNVPWQKVGERAVSDASGRLAVVEAAVRGVEGLEVSSVEIDRGGESYTADTLATLGQQYPGARLFLIVGGDVAAGLGTWERLDEIRSQCELVVVNRPGAAATADQPGWPTHRVEIPALNISSTDLRARATDGRPLDFLVPEAAVREIRRRGLYA